MFVNNMIKKWSDRVFRNLSKRLFSLGITPNRATGISIIFKFLAIYLLIQGNIILAGIMICFDYFFDMIDGSIARTMNLVTSSGFVMDAVSDNALRMLWFPALAISGFISIKLAAYEVLVIICLFSLYMAVNIRGIKTKLPIFFNGQWILLPGLFVNQVSLFSSLALWLNCAYLTYNIFTITFLSK